MPVGTVSPFSDQELRARRVEGRYEGISPLPLVKPEQSFGLSSIAPASAAAVPQHRPQIAPPKHVLIDVLASHMKTEQLTERSGKLFDAEITKNLADIEKFSAERQEALESEAKAAKARSTWSTLSVISQYISGVGMIVMGASCGGLPGALLIGAGVVGVGNRVIHDTHILQAAVAWYTKSEELQQKLTQRIEMGTFCLQMGLGLAGGVWAWQTGALAAVQPDTAMITGKVKSIIGTTLGVMSTGAKIGTSYYDKQIAHLSARLKEIETHMTLQNQAIYQDSGQMGKMVESAQSQADAVKKEIQALEISQD